MSLNIRTPLSIIFVLAIGSGCAHNAKSPGHAIFRSLDIPPDFRVTKSDYVDNSRPNAGWFLGIRMLRGKAVKEHGSIYPIHVMKAELPQFDPDSILKDDLIIGVNGAPLRKKPIGQFNRAVTRTLRKTKILSVTRWREGTIKTLRFDLTTKIPDLVKGDKPTNLHDWQLGPTGMNGWVYSVSTDKGASRDARQILVTLVEQGSPADGKMKVGDIIVGVDGEAFISDARRVFASAIVKAESTAGAGKLPLLVYRNGRESDIVLNLRTLPDAGATSPYDCPKTDAIVDDAVGYMKKNQDKLLKPNSWISYINGLGLLATGRPDVIPMLKELAHGSLLQDGETLSVEKHVSMQCWRWSYKTVFLCEYYLRTQDKAVLPTIEEYATKIAMGQSGVGSWGHTYAAKENNGHLHGRLGGYGAINQQGLTLMIALPLAQTCGVDNKEIRDAITRGETFFSYYIDKGAIPYGDHKPAGGWFDDNGKSGSAAIMFELLGNPRGTEFYSSMIIGSASSGRENGHTGCFWSHLWGGIGAARSGKRGMIRFMKEMNWAFTLERHASGRLAFQGNAGGKGKSGEVKTRWDSTGARLLQLCVPRQAICLTGKDTKVTFQLDETRIRQLIADGSIRTNMAKRMALSHDEILRLLGDELPPIRSIGARALMEQETKCVEELIAMLDSDNRFARYGACRALTDSGYLSKEAVSRLVTLIEESDDLDLRLNALDALCGSNPETGLGPAAKEAIPALLRLAVKRFDIDPRRLLQRRLGFVLFDKHGLITLHGIEGIDDDILVPAIRELLTVGDGRSRSLVSKVYPMLNEAQKRRLWNDIYRATREIAPSGIMFADGVRSNGLMLMQADGYEEGIPMTLDFMSESRWGQGTRIREGLKVLKAYGPAARQALPMLTKLEQEWSQKKRKPRDMRLLKETIQSIQSGTTRELKQLQPLLD